MQLIRLNTLNVWLNHIDVRIILWIKYKILSIQKNAPLPIVEGEVWYPDGVSSEAECGDVGVLSGVPLQAVILPELREQTRSSDSKQN